MDNITQDEKTLEFLQKLKDKGHYKEYYDYSNAVYVNNKTKVIVIDKRFNTKHAIMPLSMISGERCIDKNNVVKFMPFEKAIKKVKGMNFKSIDEWIDYCNSENKLPTLPTNPLNVYKDNLRTIYQWLSIDIFDVDGNILPKFQNYSYILPYKESRVFVNKLGLRGTIEWVEFANSSNCPINIPKSPRNEYKAEFTSLHDWLGGGKVTRKKGDIYSYDEAHEHIKKMSFNTASDYMNYYKKLKKPHKFPCSPSDTYKHVWISWAHFLGCFGNGKHTWTNDLVIYYLKSLREELINLDSIELITIINSNKLNIKLKEIGKLNELLSTYGNSKERKEVLDNIIKTYENSCNHIFVKNALEREGKDKKIDYELLGDNSLKNIKELKLFDNNIITMAMDSDNIEFLMKNQLKKLWNSVLNDKISVHDIENETGSKNFNIIKDWFLKEYYDVINIKTPSEYKFEYKPNLMQKLITYRLLNEKCYGNWSGAGSGKTLSAIFAGRYSGAKNVVILCNNSTVSGWVNSINEYFYNNNIYVKQQLDTSDVCPSLYTIIDRYDIKLEIGENNYLILNYETFQQGDGDNIVKCLLDNNIIDYIIMDEVQNIKQRDEKDESIRKNVISKLITHSRELNENLLLLAMSATPIINNLTEPKKLIELLTSRKHNELNTKDSIANGVEIYKILTRYGLRYKPDYGINMVTKYVKIDGKHLPKELSKIKKGSIVDFEKTLLMTKLEGIKKYIKPGTLLYTHYVTEFTNVIGDYVKSLGLSVGYYTGYNKSGLSSFKQKKVDVLIGSSPIGTGVDGIQKVCNTLIPIILPWTSSEYDQLIGRVNRQGSKFKNVKIYIPQVEIKLENGNIWSWDNRRYNIIKYKATLVDLAMDGIIPNNLLPSKNQLVIDAQYELIEWSKRIENNDIITFNREELKIPLQPKQIEYKFQTLGDFSNMNQNWSVSKSSTVYDRLTTEPSEWYYYHSLYTEKRNQWTEIPYMEIAKKIKREDFVIGDFGCGENLLAKSIKNKVHSFDYIAIDDTVTACDISNVPLDDEVLDVVVLSLSLMGSNYLDYLKEAYRTLKHTGLLYISEPKNKWNGKEELLKQILNDIEFTVVGDIKKTDKFIYIDAIKL